MVRKRERASHLDLARGWTDGGTSFKSLGHLLRSHSLEVHGTLNPRERGFKSHPEYMADNIKKDDIVHVIAGEWDGANGIVNSVSGDKANVSLRGIGDDDILLKFLKIVK